MRILKRIIVLILMGIVGYSIYHYLLIGYSVFSNGDVWSDIIFGFFLMLNLLWFKPFKKWMYNGLL